MWKVTEFQEKVMGCVPMWLYVYPETFAGANSIEGRILFYKRTRGRRQRLSSKKVVTSIVWTCFDAWHLLRNFVPRIVIIEHLDNVILLRSLFSSVLLWLLPGITIIFWRGEISRIYATVGCLGASFLLI